MEGVQEICQIFRNKAEIQTYISLKQKKSVLLNVASFLNSSLFPTGGTVQVMGEEQKMEQEKDPENKILWETASECTTLGWQCGGHSKLGDIHLYKGSYQSVG